jgi:hypothetical protein
MQICLCGMPGLFLFDVKDCLVELFREVLGVEVSVVILNDAASTVAHFAGNTAEHEILFSALPSPQLKNEIQNRNLPLVIALENAIDCINLEMSRGHKDYIQLLQLLTASMSGLLELEHSSASLILECPKTVTELQSSLDLLGSWFARVCLKPLPSTVTHTLLSGGSFREIAKKADQSDLLFGDDLSFAQSICSAFEGAIRGHEFSELFWPARFFFNGVTHTRPSNRKCELMGPARVLYFGPYFHIPEGHWHGIITLGFDELVPDVRLKIDVYSDVILYECIVPVRTNGVFTLPVLFNHRHFEKALEVRIFLENGEIKGNLWFGGVTLTRHGPPIANEDGTDELSTDTML